MKLLDTSSVVCIYSEINAPHILTSWKKAGYEIKICNSVHDELKRNTQTYQRVSQAITNCNITCMDPLESSEIENFRNRHPNLGMGEIETILIGIVMLSKKQRNYCVIDDEKARKVAKKYSVSLTGTYGLIRRLHQKGILNDSEYNTLIECMKKSKFRINFDNLT